MANFPFERPTGRPFVNGSTTSSVNTQPSFSNFQFKTIGKGPALLQRMSAPDPSAQMDDDIELTSTSPQDPNKFIPADVPAETSGTRQPSLQERISMFGSSKNLDVRMLEARHSSRPSVIVDVSSQPLSQVGGAHAIASQISSTNVTGPTTPKVPVSPNNHEATLPSPVSPSPMIPSESVHPSVPSQNGNSATSNSTVGSAMQQCSADVESALSFASAGSEATLDSLAVLQASLTAAFASFNALSTAPAVHAAQAAKDQCAEVLFAAQHANELAEQALVSAQQSRAAARQCLSIAESIQSWTNEFVTALESMGSAQEPILHVIKDVSQKLLQWTSDRQGHEARRQLELEGREIELRRQRMAVQLHSGSSSRLSFAPASSGSSQHQSITMALDDVESVPFPPSAEHEADTVTRAWRQVISERKRQFDEEQRKRHEAEELLEQEKRKAQAEVEAREAALAHARAMRIEAEECERRRQEEEQREIKAQEYRRIEEEARQRLIAQRNVSEERALQVAKEKRQGDLMQEGKEDTLHAQADREKTQAQALPKPPNPQHTEKLVKRLEGQRPSAQVAEKVQENQPKDKQTIQKSLPPTPTTAIPASSLSPLPSSQFPSLMNTAPHDLGNVVPKKIILAANPSSDKKQSVPILGNVPVSHVSGVPTNTTTLQSSITSNTLPINLNARRQVPSNLPPKPTRNPLPTRSAVHGNTVDPRNVDANTGVKTPSPVVHSPQGPNERISPSHSNKETSLPTMHDSPIPGLSHVSLRSISQASTIPADVSVNAMGSDLGNVVLVRRPNVPPVSLDAQKANLRGLIDANGERKFIKREVDEEKSVLRSRSGLAAPVSRDGNTTMSASNIDLPRKFLKNEPEDDIPLLSLPSPPTSNPSPPTAVVVSPASSATSSRQQLSELRRQEQTLVASQPSEPWMAAAKHINDRASAGVERPHQVSSFNISPSTLVPALVQPSVPISLPARLPSALTPPLFPSRSAPDIAGRIPVANAFDDSSRMGPDASITSSWSQPNLIEEGLPPSRPRSRVGPPPIVLDHHSPSPPTYPSGISSNRGHPPRSRPRKPFRVDHYSPERSTFSPPLSRSRSASGNNSRGVSPHQRYGLMHHARPRSPDRIPSRVPSPIAGQKRGREEQDAAGPSNRRSRYEEPPPSHPSELGNGPPYASGGYGYPEEWSHTAAYARSPSPELPPRPPAPLAERITGEPDCYSKGAARQRRHDPPPRRQPNNSHPPTRGSVPSPTRQGYRGIQSDTRPPLLDRFTDSRPPKPNQRHGPPPLEDRIASKNSLINRLHM